MKITSKSLECCQAANVYTVLVEGGLALAAMAMLVLVAMF